MSKKSIACAGLVVGLIFLWSGLGRAASTAVSSQVVNKDGRELVVISNPYVELTFEPARGGRCVNFRFLDNNEQLIGKDDSCGMFLDHWAKYTWPSGLMHLPYQYEVQNEDEKRIGIKLWVVVPPKGGGKGTADKESSSKIDTSPDLIGLVMCKTIWLNADNDRIEVEHEIKNPTAESRGVALYVQHNLSLAGNNYNDIWYLPSSQGVVFKIQPTEKEVKSYGTDWVLEPTAGWIGVRDQKTKRGLSFVFDYNYLQKMYTCGTTAEWFLETVPVGPGKSFKTTHLIKPVYGFEDLTYASRNLVSDIRAKEAGNKVTGYLDIAAVNQPLTSLDLEVTVTGWKSKEVIATKKFHLDRLGYDKVRQEFDFVPKVLTDGVVIKVAAKGPEFEENYEYNYSGDKAEYERRYGWFATKGGALAGSQGDAYCVKPPHKVKKFDKPDFSKVSRPAPDRFKCLVVFGLYTQILNIDDALQGWKSQGKYPVDFTWANCPPNAIETFPGSYDELFSYHTVVMSDVNLKAVGDIGFEMLCDYVEEGGSLLVTGGPYAFGNGEFGGARFLDVLPVILSGPFDLKWAGKGTSWLLRPAKESHPLLKGVSFDDNPRVFWNHLVKPKVDTEVVLLAGDQPALVCGRYGKGKVAVLTLSPTGKEGAGESAWWNWKGWPSLTQNLFTWFNE